MNHLTRHMIVWVMGLLLGGALGWVIAYPMGQREGKFRERDTLAAKGMGLFKHSEITGKVEFYYKNPFPTGGPYAERQDLMYIIQRAED